jgi:hypothetical protein
MEIPPADLGYIVEQLQPLAEVLIDSCDDESGENTVAPGVLCDAIEQLLVVLRGHEQSVQEGDEEFRLPDKELTELVGYGMQLFSEGAALAGRHDQPATAEALESLTLPLALWAARHGAEVSQLAPVVNCLARLANRRRDPDSMVRLYETIDVVVQSASPRIAEADTSDPTHPWRLLLLNRAVVATRSHRPQLMELAFDAIVEWLPDQATRFFAESMGQMDIIGYPDQVRAVMQDYYLRYSGDRTLH